MNESVRYENYEKQRAEQQAIVQASVIVPFTPEVYKKTDKERVELKNAINSYKATL